MMRTDQFAEIYGLSPVLREALRAHVEYECMKAREELAQEVLLANIHNKDLGDALGAIMKIVNRELGK